MNIAVFGLGYVGCVTAACLAKDGHNVIGVDVDDRKIKLAGSGNACFYEPHLEAILRETVIAGRLSTTADLDEAVRQSDVALICVGTPSDHRGAVSLIHVRSVLTALARSLRSRSDYF